MATYLIQYNVRTGAKKFSVLGAQGAAQLSRLPLDMQLHGKKEMRRKFLSILSHPLSLPSLTGVGGNTAGKFLKHTELYVYRAYVSR